MGARIVSLFLLAGLAMAPTRISSEDMPAQGTPTKLLEAWLRFHEGDWCQGVDAVFVFSKSGMEAWCLIEDERSYQKLQELLAPLRNSYRIDLYATRPRAEKKSDSQTDPPPSLWENFELRSYLGDPFARAQERYNSDPLSEILDIPVPDPSLKQRLIIYAAQTLEWSRRMERYARDLPVLARMALDPSAVSELRPLAAAACMEHAQGLGKYLGRVEANLVSAFPKSKRELSGPEKPGTVWGTPVDGALQIAAAAQNVAQRVYRFIHPEQYTVGLDELRQPSLLQALRALEGMDSDFQKALTKAALK
jgi:hypothetical protein